MDSVDTTPTLQNVRVSSPASVVEISQDNFPPLEAPPPLLRPNPAPRTPKTKARRRRRREQEDPFLAADIERAKAASLGLTMSLDNATDGALSSRRPAAAPGSPSKRLRTNTTGDAVPTPYAPIAANPVQETTAPLDFASAAPVIVTAHADPTTAVTTPDAAPSTHAAAPTATVTAPAAPVAAPAALAVAPVAAPAAPAVAPVAAPAQPVAAIAGDLPPMWLTADGLPPVLLHGIPEDLIRMYDEVSHPKFFIMVSSGNGAVMCTHGLIRESIGGFLNIDPTSFTLGTPPTAANSTSPTLWLAADIPNNLAQGIIDNRILSSTAITLFPLPYTMPVTGFIGVFAGFTIPNSDAGANTARNLLRTAITANNEIAQFVQTHHDAFGPQVSASEAWEAVLASVTVHAIALLVNGTNTVAWRLYIDPPTNNRVHWGQLCRLFGKLQIMTALYEASRAAAAKAQEQMRLNSSTGAAGSSSNSGTGCSRGTADKKPHGGGKGKRGEDYKGKGKRRERDDFY
ncbi:hypothetical protein B0H13DRAFT_1866047 [Mycena leptocephala]|nr:hypothetical protein B0H13DRAFT_1866047 [Mycena leptocephala]